MKPARETLNHPRNTNHYKNSCLLQLIQTCLCCFFSVTQIMLFLMLCLTLYFAIIGKRVYSNGLMFSFEYICFFNVECQLQCVFVNREQRVQWCTSQRIRFSWRMM